MLSLDRTPSTQSHRSPAASEAERSCRVTACPFEFLHHELGKFGLLGMGSDMTTPALAKIELLDDNDWSRLSLSVRELEGAWQSNRPELGQFVPPRSDPLRLRVLVELIKVDQERSWQRKECRRLESYLAEWPEVGEVFDAVVELLTAECLTRAVLTKKPDPAELRQRFPAYVSSVDLIAVEAEAASDRRGLPEAQTLATTAKVTPPLQVGPKPLAQDSLHDWPFGPPSLISPQACSASQRYEIRGVLGSGGMGMVYRAFDRQLNREVAIKAPRLGASVESLVRDRFIREARAAAAIRHPNVCPI